MAWVRMANGGSRDPLGIKTLYKNGTQYVSWSNPGAYTYGAENLLSATFGATAITCTASGNGNSVVTGTALPIDVTDYRLLHVKARRISGAADTFLAGIGSNQTVNVWTKNVTISSNAVETEYVVDISSLIGSQYIALYNRSYNFSIEITEVWLSET